MESIPRGFHAESQAARPRILHEANNRLRQCPQRDRHESWPGLACWLRRSHATSSTEKTGPGDQNRGVFDSVSLGSEKSAQSGEIARPCGAVVEYGPRGSALSKDAASSCFRLSASASESSDNTARAKPIESTRKRICGCSRDVRHLLGLRSKIRLRPQVQATGRLLGHP